MEIDHRTDTSNPLIDPGAGTSKPHTGANSHTRTSKPHTGANSHTRTSKPHTGGNSHTGIGSRIEIWR
jgi:hypothetical protein